MTIDSITYSKFRNISSQTIEPSSGVTLLYGKNAEGKTNALEGMYLFAYGRSFRASKEREMISFGEDIARLQMSYTDKRRQNEREIILSSGGKRLLKHNGNIVKKMSEFTGDFRCVLFCPNHLAIVRSGPAERREFLDTAIAQLSRSYLSERQRYDKILNERNNLIKSCFENRKNFEDTVDIWSQQLAKSSEIIAKERYEYTERLSVAVSELFSDMTSDREKVILRYTEPKTAEEYFTLLQSNHEKEIRAGATLYGVHHDDISISLNGKSARLYCSQGQMRSVALAMKLAEGRLSSDITGDSPVFLLDDVLSELDAERRKFILEGITGKQVIITGCDFFEGADKCYIVKNGFYEKQ